MKDWTTELYGDSMSIISVSTYCTVLYRNRSSVIARTGKLHLLDCTALRGTGGTAASARQTRRYRSPTAARMRMVRVNQHLVPPEHTYYILHATDDIPHTIHKY